MARKSRSTLQTDLDELLSLGPTPEPTVKSSRKTKRVLVTYRFEGAVWSVSVPSADLEAVCERLTHLPNDGRIRLVGRLIDTLVSKFMDISVNGTKKARGVQAGRTGFLIQIKYAAAWAYLFCGQQQRLPVGQQHQAYKQAVEACSRSIANWEGFRSRDRRLLWTAFLVVRAFEADWKRHDLKDPVKEPEMLDSFYLTYILPRLKDVKLCLKGDPTLLHPDRSAYLRFLLSRERTPCAGDT